MKLLQDVFRFSRTCDDDVCIEIIPSMGLLGCKGMSDFSRESISDSDSDLSEYILNLMTISHYVIKSLKLASGF